jgi:hypothetical protein
MISLPGWADDCPACRQYAAEFDRHSCTPATAAQAARSHRPALNLQLVEAWERLRVHWVDEHPDRVPAFQIDCANCVEWKATLADPSYRAGTLAQAILSWESTLHRAGHLMSPDPLPTPHLIPRADRPAETVDRHTG